MPTEQIEAGRETDRLVARILGWKWNDSSAFEPGGGLCSRCGSDPWWWLLHYSTDMSAAWRIVDALKTPTIFCELYSGVPYPETRYQPAPQWTCRFVSGGQLLGYGSSENPALAICMAAMRWRGTTQ